MTQKVHLSFDRRIRNREVSAAIQYGGASEGWISEDGERLVEDSEGDLPGGDLGTFDFENSDGLDVTIGPGEALVEGAYIASDETFNVELDGDTDNQTVYVGWRDGLPDTVTVGLDTAFSSDDHRIPAWEFDTDNSSVTDSEDVRDLGQTVSVPTLEATDSFTDPSGRTYTGSIGADTRRAVNRLFIQTGRHDFEIGLSRLDFDDGQFEVYADSERIESDENVNVVLGVPSDEEGYVELADGETQGSTTHVEQDMGFLPDEAVVVDELFSDLPDGADIRFEIEDENGNVVTVTREEIDSVVDTSELETFRVRTRPVLERDNDTDPTPQLDSWANYLSGDGPDGGYMDATITDERDTEVA